METAVDQGLLLEFFLEFSRFEHALKASGYCKRHRMHPLRPPKAEPDWDCYARSLKDVFDQDATDVLKQACKYLLESPPNQQVLLEDEVAWETPVRANDESDIQFLLRMVRCVRNNLFHSGKYNIEVHQDTARTERLLRSSLTILTVCLEHSPQQKLAYRNARL